MWCVSEEVEKGERKGVVRLDPLCCGVLWCGVCQEEEREEDEDGMLLIRSDPGEVSR